MALTWHTQGRRTSSYLSSNGRFRIYLEDHGRFKSWNLQDYKIRKNDESRAVLTYRGFTRKTEAQAAAETYSRVEAVPPQGYKLAYTTTEEEHKRAAALQSALADREL